MTLARPEPIDAYQFGRLPSTAATFPFSTREFARLLVLRSRLRDGLFGAHATAAADHETDVQTSSPSSSRD